MSYRVVLEARAQKQLDALDAGTAARIAGALRRVAANPYAAPNVKALKGGGFRLRVGDWRVLYDLRDDLLVVVVARVAHRREGHRRGPPQGRLIGPRRRRMAIRLDYPFQVRPLPEEDGGGYLIEFPDLPGCMSDGETIEEAIANGGDALRSWLATAREFGDPVAPPSRPSDDA